MPDNERAGETSIKRDLGGLEERGGGFVEAVEATRTPMLITDAQEAGFPIIYANPAFLGMLGLKQGEVIGRDYASVAVQHIDPETLKTTTERMASHIASTHDFLLRKQDGSTVWVSQSIDPIIKEGRIVRHLASFYDITERVLREQQLRGEKGALERRFKARAQRLQQTTERLEEEIERRMRLEATLRDTLIERDKDLRLRDFLISEIEHRTANAFQLTAGILTYPGIALVERGDTRRTGTGHGAHYTHRGDARSPDVQGIGARPGRFFRLPPPTLQADGRHP